MLDISDFHLVQRFIADKGLLFNTLRWDHRDPVVAISLMKDPVSIVTDRGIDKELVMKDYKQNVVDYKVNTVTIPPSGIVVSATQLKTRYRSWENAFSGFEADLKQSALYFQTSAKELSILKEISEEFFDNPHLILLATRFTALALWMWSKEKLNVFSPIMKPAPDAPYFALEHPEVIAYNKSK